MDIEVHKNLNMRPATRVQYFSTAIGSLVNEPLGYIFQLNFIEISTQNNTNNTHPAWFEWWTMTFEKTSSRWRKRRRRIAEKSRVSVKNNRRTLELGRAVELESPYLSRTWIQAWANSAQIHPNLRQTMWLRRLRFSPVSNMYLTFVLLYWRYKGQ